MKVIGIITILFLSGCAGGGGGGADPGSSTEPQTIDFSTLTSAPSEGETGTITYYRLEKDFVNSDTNSTKTILYGYCVNYLGNQYCWDNGRQSVVWPSADYAFQTYFGLDQQNLIPSGISLSRCSSTFDTCNLDFFSSPRIVTNNVINVYGGLPPFQKIFTTGQAVTVDCTETNGLLMCDQENSQAKFSIDVNQTPY